MSPPSRRRPRRRPPGCEALEARDLPAGLGAPWVAPDHLTLSFVPDGTPIAGHTSNLFQALDARVPTADWQRAVLQAFETWAEVAHLNVGLVPDGGQPLGTPGPAQQDPRFGDVRVGAQPMAPDALSVSLPFDPALSGTWSGDLLLNSAATLADPRTDLLAIALHEAGHVLGLPHGDDPASVMVSHLNRNTSLAPSDVAAVQALYGSRPADRYEGSSGDDTPDRAAQIDRPGSYTGATPLVAFGDITASHDVDVYRFRPVDVAPSDLTIRLRSAGISLLAPRLTILDEKGAILGTAAATTPGRGDDLTVHLTNVRPGRDLFAKVEAADGSAFAVGSYGLAIAFDARNTVSPANLDAVLRVHPETLNPDDLAALLRNPAGAVLSPDRGGNDSPGSAMRLDTVPGYAPNSRFAAVGSLDTAADVDVYRIRAIDSPRGEPVVLTASLRVPGPGKTVPRVTIVDGDGGQAKAAVLAQGGGTYAVQFSNIKPGANLYLQVAGAAVGQYQLDAVFGRVASPVRTLASGALAAGVQERRLNLYVGRSELFQFLLDVGGTGGAGLVLTVVDAAGRTRFTLAGGSGSTASGQALFLTPGAYQVRLGRSTALTAPGPVVPFVLRGLVISNPIGPALNDPTLTPVYTTPTLPGLFSYPGGTTTPDPYLLSDPGLAVAIPPVKTTLPGSGTTPPPTTTPPRKPVPVVTVPRPTTPPRVPARPVSPKPVTPRPVVRPVVRPITRPVSVGRPPA